MKLTLSLLLPFLLSPLLFAEEKADVPPFKITGMKCYSDKIINKAEVGKDGLKIEAGFQIGTTPRQGSELTDFTFPEDQKKQFFEFQFGPGSEGKELTARVNGAKTTLGADIDVISVSGKTDTEGKLPANWSLKRNWPVGLYNVYFSCDGKAVGTGSYLVKAVKDRESPIKAGKVLIQTLQEGKVVEKTTLAPSDTSLFVTCSTKGAYTKGANVRMFIGTVDEKGEKVFIPESEIVVKEWPLEDTDLIYSFKTPEGLKPGDYHMVYFVNEEMILDHEFKVTE